MSPHSVQALLPRVCTTTLQGFQPLCSFCLAPPIQRKQAIDYDLAAGRAGRKDCRAPVAPAGRPGSSCSPRRAGQAPAALQRASARLHACCQSHALSANRPRRSCERCRPRARPAISSRRGNDQVHIKHPRTVALQRADGCNALLQGHAAHCSPPRAGQRGQCARRQGHQRPAALRALDHAECPQRAAGELACWCIGARTHASRPERQASPLRAGREKPMLQCTGARLRQAALPGAHARTPQPHLAAGSTCGASKACQQH